MAKTELEEIKEYWNKKYPQVVITLFSDDSKKKYFGKMTSYDSFINIQAETIGDLINQGENFLRKVTNYGFVYR